MFARSGKKIRKSRRATRLNRTAPSSPRSRKNLDISSFSRARSARQRDRSPRSKRSSSFLSPPKLELKKRNVKFNALHTFSAMTGRSCSSFCPISMLNMVMRWGSCAHWRSATRSDRHGGDPKFSRSGCSLGAQGGSHGPAHAFSTARRPGKAGDRKSARRLERKGISPLCPREGKMESRRLLPDARADSVFRRCGANRFRADFS